MSLEEVQKKLKEATYHYDTPEAFIPYARVQEVWAGDLLEQFLMNHDPTMGTSKIAEAQHGLLRAISILTGIVPRDWSGWSRFSEIFFPPNDADAKRRRDINIPKFTKEELEDEFFLGDTNLASHFVAHRWIYFPIVLNETKQDSYEKNHRLPLLLPLFQEDHVRRQGGYGVVTKEIIPPHHIILGVMSDHLGIPGPEAPYRFELTVGRKRLPRADSANEVKQLKLLRSSLSSHKRIVSDLAIFTVGNELNIIMPWADMDLEDFLAGGYEQMQPTPCLLTELIQESKNVASAIHFLHKNLQLEVLEVERPDFRHQAICHADLKPRNILVFKHEGSSTGIWRITDFGVSRVANRAPSETSRYGSGYPTSLDARPPRGGAYRAPDTHAQRRSDVWSFGCILVRVFALGLEPASLPELDERRKEGPGGRALDDCFYRENPSALNPSVENWIQHLPTRYRDSHSPAFLEKMQKLLGSMLEINYRNRLSARKVRRDLHALHYSLIHSDSDAPPSTQIALRNLLSGSSRTSSTSSTSSSSTAISNIGTVYPPRPVKEVGVLVAVMKDGGNINLVRQILRDQVDVEKCHEGERPLIYAIKMANAAIIKELSGYQRRFDRNLNVRAPSSKGQTPLYLAVCTGDVDTVKAVIDADIDPYFHADTNTFLNELCDEKTPLMQAAFLGHAGVVSLLLDRGADHEICVQREKFNCLHYAVKSDRAKEDVIMAFKDKMDFDQLPPGTTLDSQENPPKVTAYDTPLMLHISLALAGSYKSLGPDSLWGKKFNALRKGGADVNRKYNLGTSFEESPLESAVRANKPSLVQVLVDAEATLRRGYTVPRGSSRDMKMVLKKALKKSSAARS